MMNIFVLDEDPVLAAQYQCDAHVVKMVTESAQLLCSAYKESPFKTTHYSHPCAKWSRDSTDNRQWLLDHAFALSAEYTFRYGRVHASHRAIQWCADHTWKMSADQRTPFVQAIPPVYRQLDVVQAYRAYYLNEKMAFAQWTKRFIPSWVPYPLVIRPSTKYRRTA